VAVRGDDPRDEVTGVPVDEDGCAFILDQVRSADRVGGVGEARSGEGAGGGGLPGACGAKRQARSSYCAFHHARCHAAGGSAAERRRLREVEILARVVGGRRARWREEPTPRFLMRLEEAVRGAPAFLSSGCSRIVRGNPSEGL
jgi:hypothetical protein